MCFTVLASATGRQTASIPQKSFAAALLRRKLAFVIHAAMPLCIHSGKSRGPSPWLWIPAGGGWKLQVALGLPTPRILRKAVGASRPPRPDGRPWMA